MIQKKQWLSSLVIDFLKDDPSNHMGKDFGDKENTACAEPVAKAQADVALIQAESYTFLQDEKMWNPETLVSFASGAGPLFDQYKDPNIVSSEHWSPLEIFSKAYPNETVQPRELTVLSWILPQTEKTKQANRIETQNPSERWARTRIIGETVNENCGCTCRSKPGQQAFRP